MSQLLQKLYFTLILSLCGIYLYAQNTITTQPLNINSICPGSLLDVPFTISGTYLAGNAFTVQLSNGSEYANVTTSGATYNSVNGRYTVSATIPATVAAGTTYRVRVVASNPAVIGTPSSTQFSVKTKPSAPAVTPLQVLCQGATANQLAVNTSIDVQTTSGATAKLYSANGATANYAFNNVSGNRTSFTWLLRDLGYSSTYRYPVNETTYYATQTIDGCESDKIPTTVRVLYTALYGPTATMTLGAGYGRLDYCQGDATLPLNVKGVEPAPDYYRTLYKGPEAGATYSANPLTPSATNAGQSVYTLKYEAIDNTKVCAPYGYNPAAELTLYVTVTARPIKPTVATSTLVYCQNQTANLLSASTTDTGASLVWYGTDATGGTGASAAPRPVTTQAGTFKYYVAQKMGNCEGDRAEITIEVKAASPTPTVTNPSYCVGQPAVPVSAVAASGGSLLWYAAASGGTGVQGAPTPSTTNAGPFTYYVAQTVGSSCESQRVPLTVTVNGLPPAPLITNAINSFCQYSGGSPLSAAGQSVKWYDVPTGGTGNTSQLPNTSTAGVRSYYASQTVNGCEGPRSSVAITILEAPQAPTVSQTTYEFCQGTTGTISANVATGMPVNWYIYGTSPGFVTRSQSGNTAYATVYTDQPRTMTYSVFQTSASGCAGPASSLISVTVKPTPASPTTQSVAVCQGAPAIVLQATGQNMLWYTSSTGGPGLAITPVISTSQALQTTYYVSQSQNGCESARASLSVAVNKIPDAPLVGPGLTYCQNAGAAALQAQGQNLKWYTDASTGTGQAIFTPKTDAPGGFTYYVSQTVANCESSRSSLAVKITPTPNAPATTSTLSFCQKAPVEQLKAEGTNLTWYDTAKTLATAPTPSSD
ncbi:MAG: T9SS C-terminal target domain-containing protein, partial [Cytophagaceae bacterium]